MNNAMSFKRQKTSRMTRVVLLISFILLVGRLIYAVPGAIEHHKQKHQDASVPNTVNK
ncbi:YfgG family protein [Pantoea sp. MBD-2R]|uniref:YfgG family protein n=1 Tax=unclassified Pantoea TaxID=2630326 RepID=UPI0011BE7489|nr:YfgG family protein [Pantoea sp. CCBC3-3-1]